MWLFWFIPSLRHVLFGDTVVTPPAPPAGPFKVSRIIWMAPFSIFERKEIFDFSI